MSWIRDLARAVDEVSGKVEEGVVRTEAEIEGIVLPNPRHDDDEERREDEMRMAIRNSHRFGSFATQRSQNFVKWHIDGHDYMYAVSELLESAKECIFIMDWWLSPELYLRRPPAFNYHWRLDRVLKRKADEGVKIYVIVYKEVTQTMSMSSNHTKHALEALSPNIACMRHPDHIGARDTTEFWSHHEKVVVIDNHRACIGGLDLCFGRWDTHTHPLADVHPTNFDRTLFPGQDYNNARLLDFQKVDQYANLTLSILSNPRMPWHDVHMTIAGDVVLDIVQHFIERWNEVKKRKYNNGTSDARYEWLAFPHYLPSNVALTEAIYLKDHPHCEKLHEIGHRFKQRFHHYFGLDDDIDQERYPPMPTGTCRVQAVRSVSDWSHGVLKEDSIQQAYIQLIREANHYIYIENQFFITNTGDVGPVKNQIGKALVERIISAARSQRKFQVVVVMPEVPGFSGDIHEDSGIQTIMAAQYRSINRGGHSIYELLRKANIDPEDYIRFYHLRAYDRINSPYPSFIKKMEEKSGVTFHQAQVALARQWVGTSEEAGHEIKHVLIKEPEPTTEGITISDATKTKTEMFELPRTQREARGIIQQFESAAKSLRGDGEVSDNVAQHMLSDKTSLLEERWLGTEEEEKFAYVSELLYIHSKVMIVDDRRVIMGSANINDRSQKGDGDSEIALVVEDDDMIESRMDGKPYVAARFAATLRRQLYKEHLGLIPPQTCSDEEETITDSMRPAAIRVEKEQADKDEEDELVLDPLSDATTNLWRSTAKKNRNIFTYVFQPVPSDLVRNWEQYKRYVPNVKAGHVVPEIKLEKVKEQLSEVRGALVECPMNFLIEEKDLVNNVDWSGFSPTLPIYI